MTQEHWVGIKFWPVYKRLNPIWPIWPKGFPLILNSAIRYRLQRIDSHVPEFQKWVLTLLEVMAQFSNKLNNSFVLYRKSIILIFLQDSDVLFDSSIEHPKKIINKKKCPPINVASINLSAYNFLLQNPQLKP